MKNEFFTDKKLKEPQNNIKKNIENTNFIDCPADSDKLGRHSWTLLHTIASYYPEKPSGRQKVALQQLMNSLSFLYPCEHCAAHLRLYMKANPLNIKSQEEFSLWLCQFHNEVNNNLGKEKFDCTKVHERWRDGWKDGSCN
ncbi:FAD-linked sulfhydryl oxidase ALR-like [Zophobas morio]|uniref:FAD-linked sulfhydryl oxidase ALR-like n=1 Tax=Zophobas morio TaxID=2755281 RepID=UPI003083B942